MSSGGKNLHVVLKEHLITSSHILTKIWAEWFELINMPAKKKVVKKKATTDKPPEEKKAEEGEDANVPTHPVPEYKDPKIFTPWCTLNIVLMSPIAAKLGQ